MFEVEETVVVAPFIQNEPPSEYVGTLRVLDKLVQAVPVQSNVLVLIVKANPVSTEYRNDPLNEDEYPVKLDPVIWSTFPLLK